MNSLTTYHRMKDIQMKFATHCSNICMNETKAVKGKDSRIELLIEFLQLKSEHFFLSCPLSKYHFEKLLTSHLIKLAF